MNASDPGLQEISLRIKYESFAKLTTEIGTAHSFAEVSEVLQRNLKYIFNFTHFRFLIFYDDEELFFEVDRTSSSFSYEIVNASEIEKETIERNFTLLLNEQELITQGSKIPSFFSLSQTKHVCLYPLRMNANQRMLIGAANKEEKIPSDADYRFLRLMGEFLLSKLSQLILTSRLEQMVNKRTAELNKVNNDLSTLFYRTSHDFNAPLTSLLGLMNLCKMEINNPAELKPLFNYTTLVIENTQRMLLKLKIVSEIETLVQASEKINLHGFIFAIKEKYHSVAQIKNITITSEVNTDTAIHFSTEILKTLVENLVDNSIQYHRSNPDNFIQIKASCQQSVLKISVEDNGQGIAREELRFVFDMYSRANENSKGNGLGLYLVKKITETLNGSVQAKSQLNKGSLFEISIPLID